MDSYEASRVVFSRIQNLDPENASKIIGLLLIQDHGEQEMIRLAFGPESLVQSVIFKARNELGISSNTLSTPSPFSLSRQNSSSSRLINGTNLSSPITIPNQAEDLMDEFQLSFLNDGPKSPNFYYQPQQPSSPNHHHHRRSCSVSDVSLGSDDASGWRPCLYFARGYCKNGASCRFVHGGGLTVAGSPSQLDVMDFLLHQQVQHTHNPSSSPSPRAVAALMMGEKYGQYRLERNDFPINPGSRQIYLTFPADSTFSEEDVSNYFSIYGPVQDVRIPYQQNRMFGFVTFHYADTVKLILAKGNPHFVCDARVLVKPYKEKGKVPDKFRKQQMERVEFAACGSPTGLDSNDQQLGTRMFYNSQGMWRRNLEEQSDLQQAIELQNRRYTGLQLLDVKRHNHHHRALSTGAAVSSPTHSLNFFNQTVVLSSSLESTEENGSISAMATPATVITDQQLQQSANGCESEKEPSNLNDENGNDNGNGNGNGKASPHPEENNLRESLEHILPDSLFASPKAGAGDYKTAFSAEKSDVVVAPSSVNNSLITSVPLLPATSTLDMASLKSCYFQVPRFASGHGAIGM